MNLLPEFEESYTVALKRTRIAAALIDFFILWAIGFVIGIIGGDYYQDNEGIGFHLKGLPAFLWLLSWFLIIPINEGITGQTFGKRVLKIKVVKNNFRPTNIAISIIRHLFDIVDLILLIGLIIASTNKKKKRIGDLVAGTIVIQKE
jgi:uncharacterized RDD family membrane protein YckC